MLAGELGFGIDDLCERITDRIKTRLGRRFHGSLNLHLQQGSLRGFAHGAPKRIVLPERVRQAHQGRVEPAA